jgi:hypothetical protein
MPRRMQPAVSALPFIAPRGGYTPAGTHLVACPLRPGTEACYNAAG